VRGVPRAAVGDQPGGRIVDVEEHARGSGTQRGENKHPPYEVVCAAAGVWGGGGCLCLLFPLTPPPPPPPSASATPRHAAAAGTNTHRCAHPVVPRPGGSAVGCVVWVWGCGVCVSNPSHPLLLPPLPPPRACRRAPGAATPHHKTTQRTHARALARRTTRPSGCHPRVLVLCLTRVGGWRAVALPHTLLLHTHTTAVTHTLTGTGTALPLLRHALGDACRRRRRSQQ